MTLPIAIGIRWEQCKNCQRAKKKKLEIRRKILILNNEVRMPSIGLGVLAVKNEKEVKNAIISAFEEEYKSEILEVFEAHGL